MAIRVPNGPISWDVYGLRPDMNVLSCVGFLCSTAAKLNSPKMRLNKLELILKLKKKL